MTSNPGDLEFRVKNGLIVANTLIYAPEGQSNVAINNNNISSAVLTVGGNIWVQDGVNGITIGNSTVNTTINSTPIVGYTGSRGILGYTGSNGVQGYTGSNGVMGSSGYTGSPGNQGIIGYTGSPSTQVGPLGYTGSIGYTGSQGIGSPGYTGSPGSPGGYTGSPSTVPGYTGSPGTTGNQGNQGYTGSAGNQGGAGYTGSPGTNGSAGSAGSQGYTGSPGNQGPVGYTGSPSTTIGYTGSLGPIGYTGSLGNQGLIGYTGSPSTVPGYTGSSGTTGYTGSLGNQGYTGSQGLQGTAGDSAEATTAYTYFDMTPSNGAYFGGMTFTPTNGINGIFHVPGTWLQFIDANTSINSYSNWFVAQVAYDIEGDTYVVCNTTSPTTQESNNWNVSVCGPPGPPSNGGNTSLTTNGYSYIPGGALIQWGIVTVTSSGVTVTFPTAFPTACFNIVCSSNASGSVNPYPTSINSTAVIIKSGSTELCYWQAIGH